MEVRDRIFNFIVQNPTGHYIVEMPKGESRLLFLKLDNHFGEDNKIRLLEHVRMRINNEHVLCVDMSSHPARIIERVHQRTYRRIHLNENVSVYHNSFYRVLHNRTRSALLCFLCIHRFRETLNTIPFEIMYMIVKIIWKSKHDNCWEPFLLKI
jgi:hypothetical protein